MQYLLNVYIITPAIKYVKDVIHAKAGIQKYTGCRIMSGMTGFGYFAAGLILKLFHLNPGLLEPLGPGSSPSDWEKNQK